MKLLLHPNRSSDLTRFYQNAFEQAAELFIVAAYLTDWDESLRLNSGCVHFRLIVGKDFGITRKAACEKVLGWLPPGRKNDFMVAELITGFHRMALT